MTLTLSPETQASLDRRMKEFGYTDPDQLVNIALETFSETDRSPETLAAIQRGLEQAREGKSRPWEEVKRDLRLPGWKMR